MNVLTKKHKSILVLGLIGVAGFYLVGRQAAKAAGKAAEAVNPVNNENLFYSGVNAVGDVLNDGASDGDFSLGGWIYDITHGDE